MLYFDHFASPSKFFTVYKKDYAVDRATVTVP